MTRPGWSRRRVLLACAGALCVAIPLTAAAVPVSRAATARPGPGAPVRHAGWVTSWAASAQEAVPGTLSAAGFTDQTVRDVVFTSLGGDELRLTLANVFGTTPLRVGDVTAGIARGSRGAVVPGTIRRVTFGGSASTEIPPGAQVLSDPVPMRVPALTDLAVSIYLPGRTGPATFHSTAQQDNWVSARGDHSRDASSASYTTDTQSWYYLTSLLVRSPRAIGTVVAFGDSITDGFRSTVDANARWPSFLAGRLDAVRGPTLSVADEGISGNRVLNDALCCGVNALARFGRDALDQPGARDIIVLEGINDFGFSAVPPSPLINPTTDVSARQVIAGYQQMIAQAHARGLKIFGATLLPFKGAAYYTAAGEAKREAVNRWIRTSGAFDGVIDFDKLMRDPADPLALNPAYNSGDDLHPNDAGYKVMAGAIPLGMLLRR